MEGFENIKKEMKTLNIVTGSLIQTIGFTFFCLKHIFDNLRGIHLVCHAKFVFFFDSLSLLPGFFVYIMHCLPHFAEFPLPL